MRENSPSTLDLPAPGRSDRGHSGTTDTGSSRPVRVGAGRAMLGGLHGGVSIQLRQSRLPFRVALLKTLMLTPNPSGRVLRGVEHLLLGLCTTPDPSHRFRCLLPEEKVDALLTELLEHIPAASPAQESKEYLNLMEEALRLTSMESLLTARVLERTRAVKYKLGHNYFSRGALKAALQCLVLIERVVGEPGFAPIVGGAAHAPLRLPIEPVDLTRRRTSVPVSGGPVSGGPVAGGGQGATTGGPRMAPSTPATAPIPLMPGPLRVTSPGVASLPPAPSRAQTPERSAVPESLAQRLSPVPGTVRAEPVSSASPTTVLAPPKPPAPTVTPSAPAAAAPAVAKPSVPMQLEVELQFSDPTDAPEPGCLGFGSEADALDEEPDEAEISVILTTLCAGLGEAIRAQTEETEPLGIQQFSSAVVQEPAALEHVAPGSDGFTGQGSTEVFREALSLLEPLGAWTPSPPPVSGPEPRTGPLPADGSEPSRSIPDEEGPTGSRDETSLLPDLALAAEWPQLEGFSGQFDLLVGGQGEPSKGEDSPGVVPQAPVPLSTASLSTASLSTELAEQPDEPLELSLAPTEAKTLSPMPPETAPAAPVQMTKEPTFERRFDEAMLSELKGYGRGYAKPSMASSAVIVLPPPANPMGDTLPVTPEGAEISGSSLSERDRVQRANIAHLDSEAKSQLWNLSLPDLELPNLMMERGADEASLSDVPDELDSASELTLRARIPIPPTLRGGTLKSSTIQEIPPWEQEESSAEGKETSDPEPSESDASSSLRMWKKMQGATSRLSLKVATIAESVHRHMPGSAVHETLMPTLRSMKTGAVGGRRPGLAESPAAWVRGSGVSAGASRAFAGSGADSEDGPLSLAPLTASGAGPMSGGAEERTRGNSPVGRSARPPRSAPGARATLRGTVDPSTGSTIPRREDSAERRTAPMLEPVKLESSRYLTTPSAAGRMVMRSVQAEVHSPRVQRLVTYLTLGCFLLSGGLAADILLNPLPAVEEGYYYQAYHTDLMPPDMPIESVRRVGEVLMIRASPEWLKLPPAHHPQLVAHVMRYVLGRDGIERVVVVDPRGRVLSDVNRDNLQVELKVR